ncbi:MAG: ABC transporter permease [Lachnospiraceae bacterium]|jgi:ribose/xylose/arabinose/galactoside ABC-type transport system permease subunit|nr:ABC transporter permease [Lachnospiraceae bacterium]
MKQSTLRKLITLSLTLLLVLFFSVTTSYFFTWKNICTMLREVSVIGLLSVGVSFVIIGGGIDLSTGSVLGLSAMIASRLVTDTNLPVWLILIIVLACGALLGLVNGTLVTYFGLSEFIATFATMFAYRGILYTIAYHDGGHLVTKTITYKAYLSLGGTIGGLYYMSIVWALVILAGYLVLRKTTFGVYVYAVGTSQKSARLSGIHVEGIKMATFVISSVLSSLAGIFLLAWQGSAGLNTGNGMEFQAIAAVVVGGIVLSGGRGDTLGVAIGSIFMIIVVNGIYKYGFPTEVQTIAYGAVIIVMSIFDSLYMRLMEKRQIVNKKTAAADKGGAV